VKYCNLFAYTPVASSETFLEIVLDDFFELPHNEDKEVLPEIIFDDYRILILFFSIIPLVLYFSWLLRKLIVKNDSIRHFIYFFKRLITPGYYTFLYRFRPF